MKLCWVWIIVGASGLATASAAAEPTPNAGPVCLYESEAYSEGAFVCVQKSLMLTCVAEGAHMSWKSVSDKDISDRCTAPTVQYVAPEPRIHTHWHHYPVRRSYPPVENPAKCFIFNGVQYCE